MSVSAIGPSAGIAPASGPSLDGKAATGGFQKALAEAVHRVEQFRADADHSVNRFLNGEAEDVHKVALQVQRAELAFEMFLQVRNKVVEAYQEVMRMQV